MFKYLLTAFVFLFLYYLIRSVFKSNTPKNKLPIDLINQKEKVQKQDPSSEYADYEEIK